MMTLPVRLSNGRFTARWPRPNLKRGYSTHSFCMHTFKQFFELPAGAEDIRIILSKSPHPEAYKLTRPKLRLKYRDWFMSSEFSYREEYAVKLDRYRAGNMLQSGETAVKRAIRDGYKYVRVDYK